MPYVVLMGLMGAPWEPPGSFLGDPWEPPGGGALDKGPGLFGPGRVQGGRVPFVVLCSGPSMRREPFLAASCLFPDQGGAL